MDKPLSAGAGGRPGSALNDVLMHYGIKGMKWGIRRKRNSLPASEDSERATKAYNIAKKHGTSSLSNQELQALVSRMNLEAQYSQLHSKNSTTFMKRLERGNKAAKTILGVAKTANEVNNLVNSPAGKMVLAGAKKKR